MFPYKWYLKDGYNYVPYHGKKVFSCFACGGGSTMGYKMAGYDVIGCNEIDPKMNAVYVANHNPKFNFLAPIQEFKNSDLPAELYDLDILDGSPPCSSFSMAGSREDGWGVEKKFREGQAKQVLDTLFFDFIDLAKKLQPKVVIAENVKGLLQGAARDYVRRIYDSLAEAGYNVQHFLLDSSTMGVPQKRERVFFIALRNDLCGQFNKAYNLFEEKPGLEMEFDLPEIPFGDIYDGLGKELTAHCKNIWDKREHKDIGINATRERIGLPPGSFSVFYQKKEYTLNTLLAAGYHGCILYDEPRYISNNEFIQGQTFPLDYNFLNSNPFYICGMSVPPVMAAQVSHQVYEQWLKHIQ